MTHICGYLRTLISSTPTQHTLLKSASAWAASTYRNSIPHKRVSVSPTISATLLTGISRMSLRCHAPPRSLPKPIPSKTAKNLRQGIGLAEKYMRRRYSRSHPASVAVARHHFGFRAVLYRLKAKFNLQAIAKEEMKATGWEHNLL